MKNMSSTIRRIVDRSLESPPTDFYGQIDEDRNSARQQDNDIETYEDILNFIEDIYG